ncbi:GNAT family N-acetyltransferase [Methylobacterium organophilum]|uniref:GNAT family N-acetyltransferase n=1 Tax=Methylobacterium organophilum TaxID=410 RepID=UPI001F134563|nr:GNAT family N-acetyltransferase [Methylobacterium organophilum]UMY19707.1 GNAT family N-acetyltransferase [Methylobacterium organophilum]
MSTTTVSIRRARLGDAAMLSAVFDTAWREAYQGVIPGLALERYIAKRGPTAWKGMIGRGRGLAAVEFGETIVGYAAYGRARERSLRAEGEIDELYITPEYQGIGLGTRLFRAVRNDLIDHGLARVGVWSLAANPRAIAFYEGLGGLRSAEAVERLSGACLPKIGFIFV